MTNPAEIQSELQDLPSDVDVEIYDDPEHQYYRNVWLHAKVAFTDYRGKEVTVDFNEQETPESDPNEWKLYIELPDEKLPQKRSFQDPGEAIEAIRHIATAPAL